MNDGYLMMRLRMPNLDMENSRVVGVGVADVDGDQLVILELETGTIQGLRDRDPLLDLASETRDPKLANVSGEACRRMQSTTSGRATARTLGRRSRMTPSPSQYSPWPSVAYTVVRFLPLAATK